MSSQRGNVKRTRPQKYQNKSAFRNNLHDTSKKTKEINKIEVAEVCLQCKGVIEWKIKYKKYKLLTQPKTCSNCHQKSIKHAYHTLCDPCGKTLRVCCKCRQSKEVTRKAVQLKPKEEVLAMMSKDLKVLPERKRRTFYRYVDTFYDIKKREKFLKCAVNDEEESEEGEDDSVDDEEESTKGEEMEKKSHLELDKEEESIKGEGMKKKSHLELDEEEEEESIKREEKEKKNLELDEEEKEIIKGEEKQKKIQVESRTLTDDHTYCENYIEKIRQKLEELGRGSLIDDSFDDDKETDNESETSLT